jgi:hypothetical protein
MSWMIERRGRVAIVTMNTNKVNALSGKLGADQSADAGRRPGW